MPNFTSAYLGINGQGYLDAGLPNIGGSFTGFLYDSNYPNNPMINDAFYKTYTVPQKSVLESSSSGAGFFDSGIGFNASLASSIYGNSTTVTPYTCKTYMIIKY